MTDWEKINHFVFRAGQVRTPQELAYFALHHLQFLVPYDSGVLFYLNRAGDCLATESFGDHRDLYSYLHHYRQKYSLLHFSRKYRRNYPGIKDCIFDNSLVTDPFIRALRNQLGIKYSFGLGFWDPQGYLRCLFSIDRKTDRPFSDQDKETIDIVFRHLNNLFQNLLTTAPPLTSRDAAAPLTRREEEVGSLLLQGRDQAAIADHLSISPATVGKHIANMHRKLGVQSQQELMVKLFNLL